MAVLLALKSFQSIIAEKKVAIFVVPEKKIVKLKSILTELMIFLTLKLEELQVYLDL